MNRYLMFIPLALLLLVGCDAASMKTADQGNNREVYYREYVVDGCQYIGVYQGFAHKGNCTNSIHIYNVEKTTNK